VSEHLPGPRFLLRDNAEGRTPEDSAVRQTYFQVIGAGGIKSKLSPDTEVDLRNAAGLEGRRAGISDSYNGG
jgi:hypothetical protein